MRNLIADAATFGEITPPVGVKDYNDLAGGDGIGILIFINRFIQLIFVLAGIWVLYNVISAGFTYLGSEGDAKAHQTVRDKITMSVIGLLIIVASYGFASLIGLIFFGRPDFILNPTIQGPQ
jgi:hypothetical protein